MKLAIPDLLILAAYLAGMVLFGLWMGRRQRDATDYMLGGRDLPWWAVLLSIVATETSTVTFLSIPGWAYEHDLAWQQIPIGYVLGRLLVIVVLLPRYFEGRLFTAYEVLHRRFGGATKEVASGLFVITRTLADGLRLYLSAIVLQEVAGIPMNAAICGLGVATIVYTFAGGMRAVIWTDVVQFVVYMGGAAIAFAILLGKIDGGLAGFLARGAEAGRFRMFDAELTLTRPDALWAGLLGGAALSFATHGVDQMMVQRYLCARSRGQAALAVGLSGVLVWLQFLFFLLLGVALWVFYRQQDPMPTFAAADRVFATFIVEHMPSGILALVLGAVFAAAMSTLSSSLNSSATALVNDIWLPWRRRSPDDPSALRAARGFTVLFGLAQIAVAIAGKTLAGSVVNHVLTIAGFTTGIILGVFLLGILAPRVGQRAALAGLLVGLGVMSVVHLATPLAWPWYSLVGVGTVLVAGLLAQLVVGGRPPPEVRSASASSSRRSRAAGRD